MSRRSMELELYARLATHKSLLHFLVDVLQLAARRVGEALNRAEIALERCAGDNYCNKYITDKVFVVGSDGDTRIRIRYYALALLARLAAIGGLLLLLPFTAASEIAPRARKRIREWLMTVLLARELRRAVNGKTEETLRLPPTDMCCIIRAFRRMGCENITHRLCGFGPKDDCRGGGLFPWRPRYMLLLFACRDDHYVIAEVENSDEDETIIEFRRVEPDKLVETLESKAEIYDYIASITMQHLERLEEGRPEDDKLYDSYEEDEDGISVEEMRQILEKTMDIVTTITKCIREIKRRV